MQVTYLKHSGFLLDLERAVLVFDFFSDPAQILGTYENCGKPIIFFVSHNHYDHWNSDILGFRNRAGVYFVLDQAIRRELGSDPREGESLFYVQENCCYTWQFLQEAGFTGLYCLPSTDAGVAFFLRADSASIYHAGDLNDWNWQDAEGLEMERRYRQLIGALADCLNPEDQLKLAFVPVDQRLGDLALAGAKIFVELIRPAYLIPMHLNGGVGLPADLKRDLDGGPTEVLPMVEPGQSLTLC